jgi:hypothetical protein
MNKLSHIRNGGTTSVSSGFVSFTDACRSIQTKSAADYLERLRRNGRKVRTGKLSQRTQRSDIEFTE